MTFRPNFPTFSTPAASGKLEAFLVSNQPLSLLLSTWLGGSLLLDCLVMPVLYQSGMMSEPGFAAAGMNLFSIFNRLELLAGGIAMVAVLLRRQHPHQEAHHSLGGWGLPMVLLSIPLLFTYWLSPYMVGLGAQLQMFDATKLPAAMGTMHLFYWSLEAIKLGAIVKLLSRTARV
jgi:hypothetical protein